MNWSFYKSLILSLLNKNNSSSLFIIIMFSFMFLLLSFLSFDENWIVDYYGSKAMIDAYDEHIIDLLGLVGIGRQWYFFSLLFLLVATSIALFFFSYVNYSSSKKDLILLNIKGFPSFKAEGIHYIIYLSLFILDLIVSFSVYFIMIFTIEGALKTKMIMIRFSIKSIWLALSYIFVFSAINMCFYIKIIHSKNIIDILRGSEND